MPIRFYLILLTIGSIFTVFCASFKVTSKSPNNTNVIKNYINIITSYSTKKLMEPSKFTSQEYISKKPVLTVKLKTNIRQARKKYKRKRLLDRESEKYNKYSNQHGISKILSKVYLRDATVPDSSVLPSYKTFTGNRSMNYLLANFEYTTKATKVKDYVVSARRRFKPFLLLPFHGTTTAAYENNMDGEDFEKLISDSDEKTTQSLLNIFQHPLLRHRGVNVKQYFLPVLIVADKSFVDFHMGLDYETYILTAMKLVSDLFYDMSMGREIFVSVAKIMYLDKETEQFDDPKAHVMLKKFCMWAIENKPHDEQHPNFYDVAILITRRELLGTKNNNRTVIGATNTASACLPCKACMLVQDTGLLLGVNIAHQLGHLVGAPDDDDSPGACPSEAYDRPREDVLYHHIMSPHLEHERLVWSQCSRVAIGRFFSDGLGSCLEDQPPRSLHRYPNTMAGVVYTPDMQCDLIYDGSKACFLNEEDFCTHLFCDLGNGTCISNDMEPAQGTSCGMNKWCFNRECVHAGSRPASINGRWSDWQPWAPCSRSCGAGVKTSRRYCNNPPPSFGGHLCLGPSHREDTCNTMPCDPRAPSYRAVQCAKFDRVPISGAFHTWRPVLAPTGAGQEDRCGLYCRSDTGVTARLSPRAAPGTPCRPGTRDVCVRGVCVPVACDWHLASVSRAMEDRCGVCAGNGEHCRARKGRYNATDDGHAGEYVFITNIPKWSTLIRIFELKPSFNRLAISIGLANSTKEFLINGPNSSGSRCCGEFLLGEQVGYYSQLQENQDYIMIKGPLPFAITVHMLRRGPKVGVQYTYMELSREPRPPRRMHLPERPETLDYGWEFLDWTPCSARCEGGTEESRARCVSVRTGAVQDSYCGHVHRPQHLLRVCNIQPCAIRWRVGPWMWCRGNSVQRRAVLCMRAPRLWYEAEVVVHAARCSAPPPPQTRPNAPCADEKCNENQIFDVQRVQHTTNYWFAPAEPLNRVQWKSETPTKNAHPEMSTTSEGTITQNGDSAKVIITSHKHKTCSTNSDDTFTPNNESAKVVINNNPHKYKTHSTNNDDALTQNNDSAKVIITSEPHKHRSSHIYTKLIPDRHNKSNCINSRSTIKVNIDTGRAEISPRPTSAHNSVLNLTYSTPNDIDDEYIDEIDPDSLNNNNSYNYATYKPLQDDPILWPSSIYNTPKYYYNSTSKIDSTETYKSTEDIDPDYSSDDNNYMERSEYNNDNVEETSQKEVQTIAPKPDHSRLTNSHNHDKEFKISATVKSTQSDHVHTTKSNKSKTKTTKRHNKKLTDMFDYYVDTIKTTKTKKHRNPYRSLPTNTETSKQGLNTNVCNNTQNNKIISLLNRVNFIKSKLEKEKEKIKMVKLKYNHKAKKRQLPYLKLGKSNKTDNVDNIIDIVEKVDMLSTILKTYSDDTNTYDLYQFVREKKYIVILEPRTTSTEKEYIYLVIETSLRNNTYENLMKNPNFLVVFGPNVYNIINKSHSRNTDLKLEKILKEIVKRKYVVPKEHVNNLQKNCSTFKNTQVNENCTNKLQNFVLVYEPNLSTIITNNKQNNRNENLSSQNELGNKQQFIFREPTLLSINLKSNSKTNPAIEENYNINRSSKIIIPFFNRKYNKFTNVLRIRKNEETNSNKRKIFDNILKKVFMKTDDCRRPFNSFYDLYKIEKLGNVYYMKENIRKRYLNTYIILHLAIDKKIEKIIKSKQSFLFGDKVVKIEKIRKRKNIDNILNQLLKITRTKDKLTKADDKTPLNLNVYLDNRNIHTYFTQIVNDKDLNHGESNNLPKTLTTPSDVTQYRVKRFHLHRTGTITNGLDKYFVNQSATKKNCTTEPKSKQCNVNRTHCKFCYTEDYKPIGKDNLIIAVACPNNLVHCLSENIYRELGDDLPFIYKTVKPEK